MKDEDLWTVGSVYTFSLTGTGERYDSQEIRRLTRTNCVRGCRKTGPGRNRYTKGVTVTRRITLQV